MAHVLIGFAESLSAPEVLFSLTAAGNRVSVFTRRDTQLPLCSRIPGLNVHAITAPEQNLEAAKADLARIFATADAPDAILALDDAALLLIDAARPLMPSTPAIANATGPAVQVALDKRRQIAHAAAAGLAVPRTVAAERPADLDAVETFPCIAKPALAMDVANNRIVKGKTTYCKDADELHAFRATLTDAMSPLLLQPLILGTGEGVFGFATDSGVINWSGHRRLRMMNPHGSGSSACMSHWPADDTRAKCQDFITRIGWRGPFMIELLRSADGTLWFMELNGRMWGSMALARRTGFEYPAWAVAQAFDPAFVPPAVTPPATPVTVRHLGRDLLHLLFVLRGTKSAFHKAQWPSVAETLAAVLKPGRAAGFYNYDEAHPGFFLREAADVIRKALTPQRT